MRRQLQFSVHRHPQLVGHEPIHDFTHLKQAVFLSYGPLSLVLKSPLFDEIIRTLLTSIVPQPYGTEKNNALLSTEISSVVKYIRPAEVAAA